jgi:hypothetical protein
VTDRRHALNAEEVRLEGGLVVARFADGEWRAWSPTEIAFIRWEPEAAERVA